MKRTIALFLCLALALSLFAGCRTYMPFPRLPCDIGDGSLCHAS